MTMSLPIDDEANKLLSEDPLALLIGMVLDQQVPLEKAFASPSVLRERLGGTLDAKAVAALSEDELVAAFVAKPALHRFPAAMGRRTGDLARVLVERYDGDAAAVWQGAATGEELVARLRALPGFGGEKAQIFLALLAKQLGIRPPGWEEAAGPFADEQPRSVADITSPETRAAVKAFKQARKAEGKGKAD